MITTPLCAFGLSQPITAGVVVTDLGVVAAAAEHRQLFFFRRPIPPGPSVAAPVIPTTLIPPLRMTSAGRNYSDTTAHPPRYNIDIPKLSTFYIWVQYLISNPFLFLFQFRFYFTLRKDGPERRPTLIGSCRSPGGIAIAAKLSKSSEPGGQSIQTYNYHTTSENDPTRERGGVSFEFRVSSHSSNPVYI